MLKIASFNCFLVGLIFTSPLTLFAKDACEQIIAKRQGNQLTFSINALTWAEKSCYRLKSDSGRIDEETSLTILITNLNVIRYSIQSTVEEKEIPGYAELLKLWKPILTLLGLAPVRDEVPFSFFVNTTLTNKVTGWKAYTKGADFEQISTTWRKLITAEDQMLEATITHSALSSIGITEDLKKDLDTAAQQHSSAADILQNWRDYSYDAAQTNAQLDQFNNIIVLHDALMERVGAFIGKVKRIDSGYRKNLGTKEAGRIVTVKLTPVDATENEQETVSIEYFVETKLPVHFHTGLAVTGLEESEFERVRAFATNTTNGSDLFTRVKTDENIQDFIGFLSAKTVGPVYASIGTSFADPGKQIYLAGSYRYRRIYFSVGAVNGEVAEAAEADKVVEEIANTLEVRELYTTFSKTRKWKGFIAITFGLF